MSASTSPPFALFENEQVLGNQFARHLRSTPTGWGYNPINGTLWLTTQRIAFAPDRAVTPTQRVALSAAGGASPISFPLARVREATEQPMKVQWGKPNVLKLVFDNDGREYFALDGKTPGTFSAELLRHRPSAILRDYTTTPALKPGFEQPASRGAQKMLLIWLLGVVGVCAVFTVVGVLMNGMPK